MSFVIFINYRREDSSGHTGRLYDALVVEWSPKQIFMDVDTIDAGQDFVRTIEDAVDRCDVLLAVIGSRWGEIRDHAGEPRLDDPSDFVRLELESALARDKRVIPVLVQGATMPERSELPEPLRALARRNAVTLTDIRWRSDVSYLVHVLRRMEHGGSADVSTDPGPLEVEDGSASGRDRPGPRRHRWWIVAVAALVGALVVGLVVRQLTLAPDVGTPASASAACGPTTENLAASLRAEGGEVAFVSERTGNRDIFARDVTTGETTQLTADPGADSNPSWSPDGTRIAFDSDRAGDFDIYVMDADGTDVVRITEDPAHQDTSPAWSTDGSEIAFASTRDGNSEVYTMHPDGSHVVRLTHNPAHDGQPTWSPDGTQLAFSSDRVGDSEVFAMDADGSNVQNLTKNGADDRKPAWSPAGGTIAFISDRGGDADIYLMQPDGVGARAFTQTAQDDGYPAWSPDGSWLLFDTVSVGTIDLCVARLEGGGSVDLVAGSSFDAIGSWTRS